MSANQKILDGIKLAIKENRRVTIDLSEASALTGSGDGVGGRTYFDDAFDSLRDENPLRKSARIIKAPNQSMVQFVAKTGNAVDVATGGWGYEATPNTGDPDTATSIWQISSKVLSASLPVRTAVLDDVNGLQEALVTDLVAEFGQQEGLSMCRNDDQSGSSTSSTGGVNGLRGLDIYASDTVSAYGSSGTALTDGIHTIATLTLTTPTYAFMSSMAAALPPAYWSLPGLSWQVTPAILMAMRDTLDTAGLPVFFGLGDTGVPGQQTLFGWPVVVNPHLSEAFPIYLANWDKFLTIVDVEEMTVQLFDQTMPGTITIYAERRVASSVRDPFAGVRAELD